MIPFTYPSQLSEAGVRQVVIYSLTDVTGLTKWVDYIPVKSPADETNTALANTYDNGGYIPSVSLTDTTGKQAWVDYIPVYTDNSATDAWQVSASGYIPLSNLYSVLNLFASGEQGVWYDPSDFSSMFQDAAGTTPVTAVEQPVGKILDKSGRGNHASQATTTKRPVLKIDGNGKYYLLFDGVDDALATSAIDFSATGKVSVFSGIRLNADTYGMIAELSTNCDITANTFYVFTKEVAQGDISVKINGATTSSKRATATETVPVTKVIGVMLDRAGATSLEQIIQRRNGVQVSSTSYASPADGTVFSSQPLYIGYRNGTSSLYFNGNLYSLIIRGAASTATQITNTETWVNGKTGAY